MSTTAGIKAVMMKAQSTGGVSNWQTPGYIRGNVRCMIDYYVAVGSGEDAGSTIEFFPLLEAGTVVLGFIAYASGTTSSLTFGLGDLDSASRYVASGSTAWQAAGSTLITSLWAAATTGPYVIGTNPTSGGVYTPTTTDNDAQILVTTAAASLTSSGVYGLIMFYTID